MENGLTNSKLLGLFSALFLCIGVVQAEKALIIGPITVSSTYNGSPQKYFPQMEPGKSAKLTVIVDNLPDIIANRKLNDFTETPVVLFFSLTNPDGTVHEYKRCGAYAYSYANDTGTIHYFDPSSEEINKAEMGQYVINYTPTSAQLAFTPTNLSILLPKDPKQMNLNSAPPAYKFLVSNIEKTEMKWKEHSSSEHKQPGDTLKDTPKSDKCAIS